MKTPPARGGRACPCPWDWIEVFVALFAVIVALTFVGNIIYVLVSGILSR